MGEPKKLESALRCEIAVRLQSSFERIQHCVSQLSDQQVWWRPREEMNSIGNLLLHLAGNVQQWMVDGVASRPNQRNRPSEFSERSMLPKQELITRLQQAVLQAIQICQGISQGAFLEERRIQGFQETVLSALLNSLTHFQGHTQEIVCLTRWQLGSAYRFAWNPQTPEQGAP